MNKKVPKMGNGLVQFVRVRNSCGFNGLMSCFAVPEECFILANSADSDGMLPEIAFCLGLHCLSNCQSTCLKVSRNEKGYYCDGHAMN